jgi:hypothetical protein
VGIRFAYEMNGFWYPWCESANGNHPGEDVKAFRHVRKIFTDAAARNVIWTWSPNVTYPGAKPLHRLYPGDKYVDWVGLSGYYGTGGRTGYQSFNTIFTDTLKQLHRFSKRPIVITGRHEHGRAAGPMDPPRVPAVAEAPRGHRGHLVRGRQGTRLADHGESGIRASVRPRLGRPAVRRHMDEEHPSPDHHLGVHRLAVGSGLPRSSAGRRPPAPQPPARSPRSYARRIPSSAPLRRFPGPEKVRSDPDRVSAFTSDENAFCGTAVAS